MRFEDTFRCQSEQNTESVHTSQSLEPITLQKVTHNKPNKDTHKYEPLESTLPVPILPDIASGYVMDKQDISMPFTDKYLDDQKIHDPYQLDLPEENPFSGGLHCDEVFDSRDDDALFTDPPWRADPEPSLREKRALKLDNTKMWADRMRYERAKTKSDDLDEPAPKKPKTKETPDQFLCDSHSTGPVDEGATRPNGTSTPNSAWSVLADHFNALFPCDEPREPVNVAGVHDQSHPGEYPPDHAYDAYAALAGKALSHIEGLIGDLARGRQDIRAPQQLQQAVISTTEAVFAAEDPTEDAFAGLVAQFAACYACILGGGFFDIPTANGKYSKLRALKQDDEAYVIAVVELRTTMGCTA